MSIKYYVIIITKGNTSKAISQINANFVRLLGKENIHVQQTCFDSV